MFALLWIQQTSFPLESVKVSGSQVPTAVVMEMAGLKLGDSIDKARIEDACQKLGHSGIFGEVNYRYEPGPQHGYVVTLELSDPVKMFDAAIDIPGADDKALWAWIESQFPTFRHRVPQSDEAQQYLASRIEQKLGLALHGQKLVTRMEQGFTKSGRALLSFQPETLPRVASMRFTGQSRLTAEELTAIMQKVVASEGYTDRRYRYLTELNLGRAYEERGMFKVQFPTIQPEEVNTSSVNVTTNIVEGLQYKLADVALVGDDLPREAMLAAGHFKKGEIANWTQIQQEVWHTETALKRSGYKEAIALPERVLDDANQTLLVKIAYRKGPLFHFGEVTFVGLSPELEAKARQVWKMKSGAPYDFMYWGDFLQELGKKSDLHGFKNFKPTEEAGVGENVRNLTLLFVGK